MAGRREAAEPAAGRHDTVAGNDDRDRIAAERAADGPGEAGVAEPCRHGPVGHGLSGREARDDVVNAAVEALDAVEIERRALEADRIAGEQRCDARDGRRDRGRRGGRGALAREAGACRLRAAFGQEQTPDPGLRPGEAAGAERRVEQRPSRFHGCVLARSGPPRPGGAAPEVSPVANPDATPVAPEIQGAEKAGGAARVDARAAGVEGRAFRFATRSPRMSLASVRAFLAEQAPDLAVIELPVSTATVAEAAAGHGVEPAQIAKTLSLRVGDRVMLVVARGDARLDNRKVKALFGGKPRMLSLEEVAAVTGHPVGGVCPFGLATPLPVYCDKMLLAFDEVVPAAGATNAAIRLAPQRLAALAGAEWVDVCELPPGA